jgi:hypothetical protein
LVAAPHCRNLNVGFQSLAQYQAGVTARKSEEVVQLLCLICEHAKTRAARAEKFVPIILSGRGFNDLPK